MTFEEIVQDKYKEGRAEGRAEGIVEGRAEGWEKALKYLSSLTEEEQQAILQNPSLSIPEEFSKV